MTEDQKQENRLRIGGQVAAIRKKKGLSIRELAEACGVTAQNITKIEHGKYNVSIDILGKICEALGYHVDIKPNMDEVIVAKEEMKKIAETVQRVSSKPDVVVKGSSLDEALNERMKKR
jgi:transcriptional regulator with XRE-family HTH domain